MSSTAPASENTTVRRAIHGASTWTLQQEELAREFMETYGLERKQIGFDGSSPDPIFDYEALSLLSLVLGDIPSIRTEPGDFNNAAGLASAICHLTLNDNRSREVFGTCLVGEILHDNSEVADISQALKIAQARAVRNGLRAVGFDPVKAHRLAKADQPSPNQFTDVRTKELAEIHILGKELGFIFDVPNAGGTGVVENKTAWKNIIGTHFKGKTSSGELADLERSQFLQMLRSWKSARTRTEGSEMTGALLESK